MSEAARKVPGFMDLAEFLAWDAPGPERWQLVDGEPRAMAPPSRVHAVIQAEAGRLIGNHLDQNRPQCTVLGPNGLVPRIQANINYRVPDLAITCADCLEEETLSDPMVIVEILSPANKRETWTNVWAYTTIPCLREILILDSDRIRAHLLRRDAEGNWPERPLIVEGGELELDSIGFRIPIERIYRRTGLLRQAGCV